jgi:tRNA 2-selenouridine synthase
MSAELNYVDTPFEDEWAAVIDVRSPTEFALDHLPGALNMPVLSDDERAIVGRIYVRESRLKARRLGAALIARNIADHLEGPLNAWKGGLRPLIYCWRGGMRSRSMAMILSEVGFHPFVLKGGYKNYRAQVRDGLDRLGPQLNIHVLAGLTGTAKTRVLRRMKERNFQVVDFEDLAAHRGSILGSAPSTVQPPQRLFESRLWASINKFDLSRPVWVESESSKVGDINIPAPLWHNIRSAGQITIRASLDERVKYLLQEYSHFVSNPQLLIAPFEFLRQLHSADRLEQWRQWMAGGQFAILVRDLLDKHYDPSYRRSLKHNRRKTLGEFELQRIDDGRIDALITQVAETYGF